MSKDVFKGIDLSKYRKGTTRTINKEQLEFLKVCRDNEVPISYAVMAELWEEIFKTKVSKSFIREACAKHLGAKKKV